MNFNSCQGHVRHVGPGAHEKGSCTKANPRAIQKSSEDALRPRHGSEVNLRPMDKTQNEGESVRRHETRYPPNIDQKGSHTNENVLTDGGEKTEKIWTDHCRV